MKRLSSRAIGGAIVIAGFHLITAAAYAQSEEWSAMNLTLKKTYIKTHSNTMFIHPDGYLGNVDAFTPTTVSCPGAGACVVRIDLSAWVAYLDDDLVFVCVEFDGDTQGVLPQSCGQLAPKSSLGIGQVQFSSGFTWAFPMMPGNHELSIKAYTFTDPAAALYARTLTISVFKP